MTHCDFDSVCTRFISGNSIPVERARVSHDELLALKLRATRAREKLGRQIALSESMGRDITHWNKQLVEIDEDIVPRIKRNLEPALIRKNNVATRTEVFELLQLIWRLSSFCSLIKVNLNSFSGAHTPQY